MPNYTPMELIKRYDGKPDIHSQAIHIICDAAMKGVGAHFAFTSRRTRTILRVLMEHTGWNMLLIGNIPESSRHNDGYGADIWADVINLAAEAELEARAPCVDKVIVCSKGILVRFKPGNTWKGKSTTKTSQMRLQKAITEISKRFSKYDSWGETLLQPVVAEG